MGFGSYLRKARNEQERTLLELAKAVGISAAYLSRIERERENTPRDTLIKALCDVLVLDSDDAYCAAERLPPDLRAHTREAVRLLRNRRYPKVRATRSDAPSSGRGKS